MWTLSFSWLIVLGAFSCVAGALLDPSFLSAPVQVGAPVPKEGGKGRRLLQMTCPDNMIVQAGQCVCTQAFYSSNGVVDTLINGTHMMCSGTNTGVNVAITCGELGTGICPSYSPTPLYNAPAACSDGSLNWVAGGNNVCALTGPDPWWRVDFGTGRTVTAGKMYGVTGVAWSFGPAGGAYTGKYKIWVGSNPDRYDAAGNTLCFAATTVRDYPAVNADGQPPYDGWACSTPMWGQYAFVSRDPTDYAPWYSNGGPFMFGEVVFYRPASCITTPLCLSCPAGLVSIPGSTSLADCQPNTGLQVNVTIDDTDQDMNMSQFSAGLPAGSDMVLYDDQVVVYVETCPTGYYCISDTTIPAACPAGTYRDTPAAEAFSDCLACPIGYYCPIATTNPTKCAAGTYRGTTGAKQPTDCTQCDSGNYCILGSVQPVNCSAGTYRATTGGAIHTDCLVCPVGQYCGIATTTPTQCAAGSYRGSTSGVTQDDCLVCPSGYYCPIQSVVPTQCPAGTFGNGTGASLLSQCQACLVGSYCPISSIIPTPCEAGTYRETIGATEQAECSTCPTGHYCPERSVTPTQCVSGTYFNSTHGTQDTNCQPCDPGTYCPIASTLPTSCPAGYFRDQSGGTQLSSCYICPSGQFCPERTIVPTSCLPGTYRATSGATQISDCIPCPAGQYCPFATTVPVNCPAGSYRGTSGGDDRFSCTACPTGNYCPEQSVGPVNCSSGTYRPVPGASSVAECLPCPTGEYCPLATTTATACPSGTYRATVGAAIVGDCVVCPVAHYCPIQTTTPQNCAPGSYRSTTGAHQQSDCTVCPSGNYCPETSTTPTDCPITTFRGVVGATSMPDCVPCPAGLYCPVETTTPVPCAAGSYRGVPSAGDQADCPVCPVGSYCPLQTVTPIRCRAGTHRDIVGGSQLSHCLLCQPGTYSLVVGRSSNCPLCESNFYCRTSTTKDVCPLHTTSSSGSYSRVNCLCDPGYQCTYYKQIQAVVTLNATLWEFNNDINGVRTAFINAMAAAAGVHPSYVTINEVMAQGRRRRNLLSDDGSYAGETINVHASVTGAVKLRDLDKHLNRHSASLHIAHRWEQAPQIHAIAIRSNAVKPAPSKPVAAPREKRLFGDLPMRDIARERIKARSIKLVNDEYLMDMLKKQTE